MLCYSNIVMTTKLDIHMNWKDCLVRMSLWVDVCGGDEPKRVSVKFLEVSVNCQMRVKMKKLIANESKDEGAYTSTSWTFSN